MKIVKYLNIAAALVLAAMFLTSCFTERKATKQVDHAALVYPEVLAKACLKNFAPVTVATAYNSDTAYLIDSVWVDCPSNETALNEITAEEYAGKQSFNNITPPKYTAFATSVKVPVKYRTINNTKTITIYDRKKEVIFVAEMAKMNRQKGFLKTLMIIGFSLAAAFLTILFFILKRRRP